MFESMVFEGTSEIDLLAGPRRGAFLDVKDELAVLVGIVASVGMVAWAWWVGSGGAWLAATVVVIAGLRLSALGLVEIGRKRRDDRELARRIADEQGNAAA